MTRNRFQGILNVLDDLQNVSRVCSRKYLGYSRRCPYALKTQLPRVRRKYHHTQINKLSVNSVRKKSYDLILKRFHDKMNLIIVTNSSRCSASKVSRCCAIGRIANVIIAPRL
jgi:hypothetical protein